MFCQLSVRLAKLQPSRNKDKTECNKIDYVTLDDSSTVDSPGWLCRLLQQN